MKRSPSAILLIHCPDQKGLVAAVTEFIAQDVIRVNHVDSVKDLIRKGRHLEKIVLSRAIWKHLQRKTLVYENRTVVFA